MESEATGLVRQSAALEPGRSHAMAFDGAFLQGTSESRPPVCLMFYTTEIFKRTNVTDNRWLVDRSAALISEQDVVQRPDSQYCRNWRRCVAATGSSIHLGGLARRVPVDGWGLVSLSFNNR